MSRYGRLSTDEIDPDDAFGVDVPSDGPRSRPLLAVALLAVLSAATGALIAHFCWPPLSSHSMTGAASLNVAYPFESWMGDHWSSIASKPIWDLTLPGTHNSGNTLELPWEAAYADDSRYGAYLDYARGKGLEVLPEAEFHRRFVLWNINHHATVTEQLRHGIRWFHLKVCNMDGSSDQPSLDRVLHCHRGYTATSLAVIAEDIAGFLREHPHEFAVVGINDLFGFSDTQRASLARALETAFAGLELATAQELRNTPLETLAHESKRVAVFVPAPGAQATRVIDSGSFLSENWDSAVGGSGDLAAFREWMVKDIRTHAVQSERFYVVQANPNNNDGTAFASLYAHSPATLYSFEYDFLRALTPTVIDTMRALPPTAHIHAVSTDFMHEARVTELALALNRLQ